MKKVLWFSRHQMSDAQLADLVARTGDEVEVTQVNRTINHAVELAAEVDAADIVAIVAPIALQAEFLQLAGCKQVITSLNNRSVDENNHVVFSHVKWERLVKVEVVKSDYVYGV